MSLLVQYIDCKHFVKFQSSCILALHCFLLLGSKQQTAVTPSLTYDKWNTDQVTNRKKTIEGNA